METERNRSCKTGIYPSSTVERRRSCICSNTKRVHKEIKQKERRIALKSALTSRVQADKFVVIDEFKFDEIKTKNVKAMLDSVGAKKALVVMGSKNDNLVLSARNLPGVKTALTSTINVYDILKYDTVVVSKEAVANIEEVYA